jgi:hypothetical protein
MAQFSGHVEGDTELYPSLALPAACANATERSTVAAESTHFEADAIGRQSHLHSASAVLNSLFKNQLRFSFGLRLGFGT